MVVQHNLTAMNSNRMLGITTGTQAKSTEKLSSGYKINRAADDAAGLSISEKMRKQIRGLTQASLNAEDGISAVQTAEGALNEVQDMLQRANELAVKAANGTMSANDRNYIQDEIDQLMTEIDRVSTTTKFNETYLLKGDADETMVKEYSYKKEITVDATFEATDPATKFYLAGETSAAANLGDEEIIEALKNNTQLYTSVATVNNQTDAATHGNEYTVANATGVHAGTGTSFAATYDNTKVITDVYTYDGTKWTNEAGDEVTLTDVGITLDGGYTPANGDTITTTAASVTKTGDVYKQGETTALTDAEIIAAKEAGTTLYKSAATTSQTAAVAGDYTYTAESKVAAKLFDAEGNEIAADKLADLYDEDGTVKDDVKVWSNADDAGDDAKAVDIADYVDAKDKVKALTLSLHVGADSTDDNQISVDIEAMSAEGLGLVSEETDGKLLVNGADDTNARNAIDTIAEALQKVSTQRSALGAVQNRLEHTIANLDNVVENTTAAESQIRDTDMATEMVKYSNNNILAQAGQAMLAQANQANQGVLSLLG